MKIPELLIPLSSGILISYEEVLSPYEIYSAVKHNNTFILIPKKGQEGLDNIVIVANLNGIKICNRFGWPTNLPAKIKNLINCKHNKKFLKSNWKDIPLDIQTIICNQLVNQIKYVPVSTNSKYSKYNETN